MWLIANSYFYSRLICYNLGNIFVFLMNDLPVGLKDTLSVTCVFKIAADAV